MSQRIIKKNGTISTVSMQSFVKTEELKCTEGIQGQIQKQIPERSNPGQQRNGINSRPARNLRKKEDGVNKNPKKSHNIIETNESLPKITGGEQTSQNQINPTFLLKSLNIYQLIKDYEQGLFKNIIPPLAKLYYKGVNRIFLSKLSSKQTDGHSYKFTNKRGEDIIVHTYGHNALKAYIDNVPYVPVEPCFWCMTRLNDPDVDPEQICNLVIDYCYTNNQHIFWSTLPFCHISCYYRYLLEELKKGRSSNYSVVNMTLFRTYCSVTHGDDVEIIAADDKEVLINNNGFKAYKDYHSQNYKKINLIRNSEVYKIPCRIEFTEC